MVFYECLPGALQSSFQPITTDLSRICNTCLSKSSTPMPHPRGKESLQLRKIKLSPVLQQHSSHFKKKLLLTLIHNTDNVHGTSEANLLWLVSAINLRGQFLQKVFLVLPFRIWQKWVFNRFCYFTPLFPVHHWKTMTCSLWEWLKC